MLKNCTCERCPGPSLKRYTEASAEQTKVSPTIKKIRNIITFVYIVIIHYYNYTYLAFLINNFIRLWIQQNILNAFLPTASVEKRIKKKTTLTESPVNTTPVSPLGLHVLDKTRNYLSHQLNLTTPAGIIHPHLRSVPIAAFTPEQLANLDSYFEKKFVVHNDKFDICFHALISGEELVADLIAQCAKGIPVTKIGNVKLAFKSFETAGSVTKKAITIPYLENLTKNLITYSNEFNQVYIEPHVVIQHVQNIFTPELKQHLTYRLKLPIPDGDYRLHLAVEFIPDQAGLILKALQEILIDIVAKQVPKITDISLKERIIAVIKEQYSHENLKWLTVDYPDFERGSD